MGETRTAGDYQTANPIFGRTSNPWNVERTAGGSRGGAAAALAVGMTPLEVVPDLTGSASWRSHTSWTRAEILPGFRAPPGG